MMAPPVAGNANPTEVTEASFAEPASSPAGEDIPF
jgi:hypothetical protein